HGKSQKWSKRMPRRGTNILEIQEKTQKALRMDTFEMPFVYNLEPSLEKAFFYVQRSNSSARNVENLAEKPHANDLMTNLDWLLKNLYNQEYKRISYKWNQCPYSPI
ncbi:hypothetical protein ACQCVO_20835, partial [Bacillus infantis]|uniref:hypothetical protein n=1 Tax=Bacillus infantis TaxID=324767 RepID=UPI003CF51C08